MISISQTLRLALFATAAAIYFGLGYLAVASDNPPLIALVVGVAPMGIGTLMAAWNSRARTLALVLCAAAVITTALNYGQLRNHIAWLFFLQHAGTMAVLGLVFGSTLGRDHKAALCSRIASFLLRAPLDAAYLHYTWKVTLAWTVFFAVFGVLSVMLFFLGPIDVWSAFANLLTPVSVGAMFAGEYLLRLRVMPHRAHFSIIQTIQAYREYGRQR